MISWDGVSGSRPFFHNKGGHMAEITIAGRHFALAFTLNSMIEMQKQIPDFSMAKISEYPRTPEGLRTLILALAREGEFLEGRTLDVDAVWLGSHIKPSPARIAKIQTAIIETIMEGMELENDDGSENEETDVVLEEIRKKETPGA